MFLFPIVVICYYNLLVNSSSLKNRSTYNPPEIFIIGVMKSATTSLSELLYKHPSICHEEVKEKHFFDVEHNNNNYKEKFSCRNSNKLNVDATPKYFSNKVCPANIIKYFDKKTIKKKKFILLLREPVTRLYSQYQFMISNCAKYLHAKEAGLSYKKYYK